MLKISLKLYGLIWMLSILFKKLSENWAPQEQVIEKGILKEEPLMKCLRSVCFEWLSIKEPHFLKEYTGAPDRELRKLF